MTSIVERLDEACRYIDKEIYRSVMTDAASEIERLQTRILELESSNRYLEMQAVKAMQDDNYCCNTR